MKLTKTESILLAKKSEGPSVIVSGTREILAARKLVQKGLAKSIEVQPGSGHGESYYNHFTRCWATRRTMKYVSGGTLTF